MHKVLIFIICLLISSTSYSSDKAKYEQFFDEYQRLFAEFDVSVIELYADDAKIMGARKKTDGTEESMTIDGTRWKNIITSSMDQAKKTGDRSEYKDVAIELNGDAAKIRATRYANIHCFSDNRFYLVVKSSPEDQLQIVEQFMETPLQSSCEAEETDLPEFLQTTAKMINEQLPAKIDAETQLVRTTAKGTKLSYHYVLINHTSTSLSTDEATAKLQPLVIQQSCSSPNLRPILDQNGSLSYIYRGSDAVQIVKLDVDKTACAL